jgi:hypothetical protein
MRRMPRPRKKYKYPPEGQEDAIGLVLKQAEVLAEGWG